MSIGSRLFRALRANVGHAVRRLGRDDDPELDPADLEAALKDFERSRSRSEGESQEQRRPPNTGRAQAKREALEKAYRVLELDFGASPEAIKTAHRRLMRQFHPDRFANDPERLDDATRLAQELSIARDALLEAHERNLI